jgi:uncharacterized membrane protein
MNPAVSPSQSVLRSFIYTFVFPFIYRKTMLVRFAMHSLFLPRHNDVVAIQCL